MADVTETISLEWDGAALLSAFLAYLDEEVVQIPEEYRDGVSISWDYGLMTFCLEYDRPESTAEKISRLKKEDKATRVRRACDLLRLAKLKEKYE